MKSQLHIPCTNKVWSLHSKLQTKFCFPLRFMAQAQSKQAINPSEKKTASITYKRGKENKVSKVFILSVGANRGKISIQRNF